MKSADVVVIGGGMAGASVAYELAADRRVVLVDQESQLAHHTTGRSAALFLESYGPPVVRALTSASRRDFDEAPSVLGTDELLHPRLALWVAPPDQVTHLESMAADQPALERWDPDEVVASCPVMRGDGFVAALVDRAACDIDVLALHQGYVRGLVERAGTILRSWRAVRMHVGASGWHVDADGDTIVTGTVVLAAGAWCDDLAAQAGARPVGLRPLRRTIAVSVPTVAVDQGWPLVGDVDHTYYWRVEGPNVLCSPADETPTAPCDARPEEADVALALERVNATTTLGLRSVRTAWAGIRTFAPDRVPVAGEDPERPGLWWLAGQGGYGIQTAPALARSLASLVRGAGLPADVRAAGVDEAALSPARFTEQKVDEGT